MPSSPLVDDELHRVARHLKDLDPSGERMARVFRETFDQLYDGQRTGRYKWDQLYKTEKTHFGTLIEINLQREFDFDDGDLLDYKIEGIEVDCKYSFREGGWMLPPESFGQLVMVSTADDSLGTWSLGLVRVNETNRRTTYNRDGKTGLSVEGRQAVQWVFRHVEMPPNVFLRLPPEDLGAIFLAKPGQARLDELFRRAINTRIHRSSVATAAQQYDYMKRVRYNGGSRSNLRPEGILILGGDYDVHRRIASEFGAVVPARGEFVSIRVATTSPDDPRAVWLDGQPWALAERADAPAPLLPTTKRGVLEG